VLNSVVSPLASVAAIKASFFCFEVIISLHSVLLQLLCRAEVFQMISPAQPISTFGSMRF
jgi:hypothetical protein